MAPSIISKALPLISQHEETSDFSLTVAPFIHHFFELPSRLLSIKSLDGLRDVYLDTNPVISAFAFSLLVAQIAFVVSTINKNYSQIDRVWSILPGLYNAHYWYWAKLTGIRSQRLDVLAIFSACWSARLTFNYWRKGGYDKGSEDYRWKVVKSRIPNETVWVVFNYVVISLFQSVLLFFIATPFYILVLGSRIQPEIISRDALFPQILSVLLVLEFYADNQQWEFHLAKHKYQRTAKVPEDWDAKDLDRGFNTLGLWQYSRHPNFAAEQAIWAVIYEWGCFQSGSIVNWTAFGAFFYLAVFQGSTPITENISSQKYPEYKEYKRYVGRFVPKLLGPKWDDYLKAQEKKNPIADATPAKGADKLRGSKKLR
ncbi:DUF1295-domain-containing protein [Myriangium duriaei CBS 260.36]|uniref:DUF1295-domain-containing protein n=1 Tax=Myriangium duriaei CBS 260.36 TaxID=1168546 RepID=A0A9P4ME17_9PEZI|nr:DUF1295-domain-containing protein [Myriangium duriaei CBS 260.36]